MTPFAPAIPEGSAVPQFDEERRQVAGETRLRLQPVGTGVLVASYYDWSELDPTWQSASGSFPVVPESALKVTLGILDRTVRRRRDTEPDSSGHVSS